VGGGKEERYGAEAIKMAKIAAHLVLLDLTMPAERHRHRIASAGGATPP